MPFNFEIEGDWDESAKPYDKKTPKPLKLDDSGPSRDREEMANVGDVQEIMDIQPAQASDQGGPSDDVRIKQIEAVTQQVLRKLKAIEERLGLGREP